MGSSYNRSVNASCACGTLAKLGRGLGNLFSDVTRVWYLLGFYGSNAKYKANNDFMMTAAHEAGHSILASYAYKSAGLSNYSWVHKGSSKGIGSGYSTPKRGEKGYESYPGIGADLMKYYSYPEGNFNPANFTSTEYDIKNLVWLTQLNLRG